MRSKQLILGAALLASLQLHSSVPLAVAQVGADTSTAIRARNGALPTPALTPLEQRIVAEVDARAEEAVRFLARVVDINSGTGNPEGVRSASLDFRSRLETFGFRTR